MSTAAASKTSAGGLPSSGKCIDFENWTIGGINQENGENSALQNNIQQVPWQSSRSKNEFEIPNIFMDTHIN